MPDSKASDLAALSALRLRSLNFQGCPISDLTPIRMMPLEELDLRGTRVADLSPLIGMSIKSIDLSLAPVLDFSPLAQLPLEKCYLQRNRITDLSVLRGKPLKELVLWGCAEARNYAVLAEIKSLELLLLPSDYRGLPAEDYAAIGSLREHSKLRQLGSEIMGGMGYAATGSKDVFWRDWDREQRFVPALRASGIKFLLQKLSTGTYSLEIQNQPLSNLSMLTGAPISRLDLVNCQFSDLAPIRDLPLDSLNIPQNPVTDLNPLRGKQIKTLYLSGTRVSDLSPLTNLPLKELYLDNCEKLTDVASLAEIQTLERVVVPMQVAKIEALRKLPRLQMLAFQHTDQPPYLPDTTAEVFWKRWPSLSWASALNEAGITYSAGQDSDGTWTVTVGVMEFHDLSVFKRANISYLNLNQTSVTDLAPLADLPLKYLYLDRTPVSDLTPLGGIPLKMLSLRETQVTDLTALRRAPLCSALEALWLYRTHVVDFSPVAACTKLTVFDATDTRLRDLEPVRGRQLREAYFATTQVRDLSILAGMPLTTVYFDNNDVTDVTPLLKCPTLTTIILPRTALYVEALRKLPHLERISYTYDGNIPGPSTTATGFWKEYDQGWVRALQESGVPAKSLKRLDDGTWELDLSNKDLTDLTILSGAPISRLWLMATAVSDLKPLRGMPLRKLGIYGTQVTDLTPLKGMRLEYLNLVGTKVTDLSALHGMPLTTLQLDHCTELTDLLPLADAKDLTALSLPPNAKDIEFLRTLPKLQRLSFSEDASHDYRPDKTAAEFWAGYDKAKK